MMVNQNAPVVAASELTIAADPEAIWDVMAAIERWPSWNPDVRWASLEGELAAQASGGRCWRWRGASQPGLGEPRRVRHRWDSGPRLLAWIEKQLRELAGTRWIIVLGGVVAVLVFVASLVGGTRAVPAFFLGLGAYASVVGLAGASRQIWRGAEVTSAPVPGAGALDVTQTVQAGIDELRGTVAELNERVTAQMTDVDQRLYDLEKAVFGEPFPEDHGGE